MESMIAIMNKPKTCCLNGVARVQFYNAIDNTNKVFFFKWKMAYLETLFFQMIPAVVGAGILERESQVFSMPSCPFKLLLSDSQVIWIYTLFTLCYIMAVGNKANYCND